MAIPSQQIGWSQKSKLLWNISKQLEKLTQVAGNVEVSPVGPTTTSTSTSSTTTTSTSSTTTTTTTAGPTPSYTGTININTAAPGNGQFKFLISSRDLGSPLSVGISWGDNTAENYTISSGSTIYPEHTYSSNASFTVTITVNDPSLLNTISIDPVANQSGAIPTGFNFSDLNGMALIVASNTVLHTADTAGLTTLNTLIINNADLESLALVNSSSLQSLYANDNNLSVLDLTSATALVSANLANNELVGLDIDSATALINLDLSNNALAEPNVDAILLALVANNQNNGIVNLTGVANDAPSSTGLGAKATLESRGWTVSVNTSSTINTKLMYYVFGYSYGAKDAMFLNNYYFNSNVNKYNQWYVNNNDPKTVYYVGTFGPGTTLYTNPELTQFVVPQQYSWNYWMGVFVDATIPETDVPGTLSIYSFSQSTGVILNNLGTIADSTYTNQQIVKADNVSTYCDNNNAWQGRYAYYPPLQNGPILGGYVFGAVDQYTGAGIDSFEVSPVFRESSGTTVYTVNVGNGLITASNPCTYIPTWNAGWGATAQDAINAPIPIAIKPLNGTSMLNCNQIKKADDTPFDTLPSFFYIAYDGVVRAFGNGYYQAYWDANIPLQPITPPVTPYSYQVLQTSSCGSFYDPSQDPYKITVYSNFPAPGYGIPIYTDAGLTTLLNYYTYYTNGSSYFNFFDFQWVYIYESC